MHNTKINVKTNINFNEIANSIIELQNNQNNFYKPGYPYTITTGQEITTWQTDAQLVVIDGQDGKDKTIFAIPQNSHFASGGDRSKISLAYEVVTGTFAEASSPFAQNNAYTNLHYYKLQQSQTYNYVAKTVTVKGSMDDNESIGRLRNESDILKKLGRYAQYSENSAGTSAVLIEEFVRGTTLADFLWDKTLPIGEADELKQKITSAVDEIHGKDVIHNDLHGGNIMVNKVDNNFIVTIIDFGWANQSEHLNDKTQLQQILDEIIGHTDCPRNSNSKTSIADDDDDNKGHCTFDYDYCGDTFDYCEDIDQTLPASAPAAAILTPPQSTPPIYETPAQPTAQIPTLKTNSTTDTSKPYGRFFGNTHSTLTVPKKAEDHSDNTDDKPTYTNQRPQTNF